MGRKVNKVKEINEESPMICCVSLMYLEGDSLSEINESRKIKYCRYGSTKYTSQI